MQKHLLPLALLIFVLVSCTGNTPNAPALSPEQLEAAYQKYKEPSLSHRKFTHQDMLPLIEKRSERFKKKALGASIQGREIYQLAYGEGTTTVMLWSQMHGNESTATMALFDLFNFLEGDNDAFVGLRTLLRETLDLRFIPMVNPDGAEVFQRRNSLDIDLNRDALHGTTSEASILKAAREEFQPAFGFNLHDQQIYYNAKGTAKPATISVLAPAYNEGKDINDVRKKSMQLIVGMNQVLQQVVPGHVGKYDDAFEPRAFGDNFQKWGTSTILIESGGYPNDPEKQFIRQLNFMIILNALYEIATQNYHQYQVEDYFAIPDNDNKLMDLIIRKVQVAHQEHLFEVDLGIKQQEVRTDSSYRLSSSIVDKGDLSVFYGYKEIDATGMVYEEGKIFEKAYDTVDELNVQEALELLKEGYLAVRVNGEEKGRLHQLPLVVTTDEKAYRTGHELGRPANFLLRKDNDLLYAIINGHVINLKNPSLQFPQQYVF